MATTYGNAKICIGAKFSHSSNQLFCLYVPSSKKKVLESKCDFYSAVFSCRASLQGYISKAWKWLLMHTANVGFRLQVDICQIWAVLSPPRPVLMCVRIYILWRTVNVLLSWVGVRLPVFTRRSTNYVITQVRIWFFYFASYKVQFH